jgi:hypothetical protein
MSSVSKSVNAIVLTEPPATRVAAMPVNPRLLHVYWQISQRDLETIHHTFHEPGVKARPVLRLYDITYILFDGTNAHHVFDVEVDLRTLRWNVALWSGNKSYIVELGYELSDGSFYRMARSNMIHVPREEPSHRLDENYLRIEGGVKKSLVPVEVASVAARKTAGEPRVESAYGTWERMPRTFAGKTGGKARDLSRSKPLEGPSAGPFAVPQRGQAAAGESMRKEHLPGETNPLPVRRAADREDTYPDLVQITLERFSFGISSINQGVNS